MTSSPYPFSRGVCGEGIGLPLFMRVHIMENLTWSKNTVELEKNAQQRVDFLRVLSRNDMPQKLLVSYQQFLAAHPEHFDLLSVWVWSSSCRFEQRKVLQGGIKVS